MAKLSLPFLRTPYNYDMNAAGDESGLKCDDPSLAQQQFKEEADINTILERFARNGGILNGPSREPLSGDFTGFGDFHSAMNTVVAAQQAFADLPAKVRTRFNNDPGQFVDFVNDESNRDEAVKLGLISPPEPVGAPESPKAIEGATKGKVSQKPSKIVAKDDLGGEGDD